MKRTLLLSMAAAAVMVACQQGPSDAPVLKAHACAKHLAVHSGPEWSRHTFNAKISERDLRETYLPAFKDLVTKADVQEVMIAYNRFRDVPCGANDYLVNTILRGEWGFKGLVVSDCWAIHDFYADGCHGYSKDVVEATAAALNNGVDLNCGDSYGHIPEAVERGLLDEAVVDKSLTRLLAARIRLGELDGNIAPWDNLAADILEGPEHLALSRKIAQESLVLLQNKGDILPLKADARIALIGPNADGPLKSLRGFKRAFIPAGQTVEVSIPLTDETFLSWSEEKQNMVPAKGEWELLYGSSSASLKTRSYKY